MRYNSPRPHRACRDRKTDDVTARAEAKPRLLPKEAYAILRTYCTQTARYPDKAQLAELVKKIRSIPGCEDCKPQKLQAYFKERRKTESRARTNARFKAGRGVKPVEIIEVDSTSPPTPSPSSSAFAVPDETDEPELPRPSLPNPHLHLPILSLTDSAVPKTFVDLAKWMQDKNRHFLNLVTMLQGQC